MEKMNQNTQERKSVAEGGLEAGIEQMRNRIETLTDMVNQIDHLKKVPAGYMNLAGEGKVDDREISALDQWDIKRIQYDGQFNRATEKLNEAYMEVLNLLDVLRGATGISSKEDALKFDKDTGRQDKDK